MKWVRRRSLSSADSVCHCLIADLLRTGQDHTNDSAAGSSRLCSPHLGTTSHYCAKLCDPQLGDGIQEVVSGIQDTDLLWIAEGAS